MPTFLHDIPSMGALKIGVLSFTPMQAVLLAMALLWGLGLLMLAMRRRAPDRLPGGGRSRRGVEHDSFDNGAEAGRAEQQASSAYAIRPLSAEMRDQVNKSWRAIAAQFGDEPRRAVTRADELLSTVMSMRGYPVGVFARRGGDLPPGHADVVRLYCTGHAIARRPATMAELRWAMVHFRALLDDLVNEPDQQAERPVLWERFHG